MTQNSEELRVFVGACDCGLLKRMSLDAQQYGYHVLGYNFPEELVGLGSCREIGIRGGKAGLCVVQVAGIAYREMGARDIIIETSYILGMREVDIDTAFLSKKDREKEVIEGMRRYLMYKVPKNYLSFI